MHDVAVIGLGPVGATLARLLKQQGLSVQVLERAPEIYPLPRAVHFDAEVMRVFQGLGLADAVLPLSHVSPGMRFVGADGALLLDWPRPTGIGPLGWHASYRFHQPELEALLREGLAWQQAEVTAFDHEADAVTLHTTAGLVSARYVVGCDGANSLTRAAIGGGMEDLGFAERWLVVDVILRRPCPHLGAHSIQFCDPHRPATYVRGVGDRRRFEIRLEDHEAPVAEEVWPLLARWLQPEDAVLERHAVYTFRSMVAQSWRRGRLMIAGDAAHLTPPFLGQGLCAGIRDAAALAWRLARVLRGEAPETLLDTYGPERAPHVREFIAMAVRLGGLINTRAMAVALDGADDGPALMRTPAPRLGGFAAPLGVPAPQPCLSDGSRHDDRVGPRFAVWLSPGLETEPATMDALAARGAVLVQDAGLLPFLDGQGAAAALIRPDRILAALSPDAAGVADFLHHL
jgi:3-(3-hydroxy-phenyl)propionate hydroxylase